MQRLTRIVLVVIGVCIAAIAVWTAYLRIVHGTWPEWTGFGVYTGPLTKDQRGKTLWDWMDLLIVPAVLAAGAILFNKFQRENEQIRVTDQQREEALQKYLDKMSELLLEKGLLEKKDSESEPTLDVAQVRTVTTFRMLDTDRREILLQFLRDAKLADFTLRNASLIGIDLGHVNLLSLNLSEADLFKANLSKANLAGADLRGADLQRADLRQADLTGAKLSGADLSGADLRGAYLTGAILSAPPPPPGTLVFVGGIRRRRDCPAKLTGANLAYAHFGPRVDYWHPGGLVGPALIGGASLSGVDFTNAKGLKEAHFQGAFDEGTAQWPDDFDRTAAGLVDDLAGVEKAPRAAGPPSGR